MNNILIIIVLFFIFYIPSSVFADSLMITKTSVIENEIEYDGIWTHEIEWKRTSLKEIDTKNGSIYLRFAHQDNYLYFLIYLVADKNPE